MGYVQVNNKVLPALISRYEYTKMMIVNVDNLLEYVDNPSIEKTSLLNEYKDVFTCISVELKYVVDVADLTGNEYNNCIQHELVKEAALDTMFEISREVERLGRTRNGKRK